MVLYWPVWRTPRRVLPVPAPEASLPIVGAVGGPISGRLSGFQTGPAPLSPYALFFRAGYPIGGPTGTSFRGVRALSFPTPAYLAGPGSPLSAELLGYAGAPILRL